MWRMERPELYISNHFLKTTMRPTVAGGAPVAPGVPAHPRWIYISRSDLGGSRILQFLTKFFIQSISHGSRARNVLEIAPIERAWNSASKSISIFFSESSWAQSSAFFCTPGGTILYPWCLRFQKSYPWGFTDFKNNTLDIWDLNNTLATWECLSVKSERQITIYKKILCKIYVFFIT